MCVRTCKTIRDNGELCRAAPLQDAEHCLMHSAEHAEQVQEGRRLGGQHRRREVLVACTYDFGGLRTADDIRRFLEVTVLQTFMLPNTVGRNRTLAYLAQVGVRLLECSEHETRLDDIEAALGPRLLPQRSRP